MEFCQFLEYHNESSFGFQGTKTGLKALGKGFDDELSSCVGTLLQALSLFTRGLTR